LVSEISTIGVMIEVIVFMAQEKVLLTVVWEGRAVLFGLLLNLYRTMLNILSPFKNGRQGEKRKEMGPASYS